MRGLPCSCIDARQLGRDAVCLLVFLVFAHVDRQRRKVWNELPAATKVPCRTPAAATGNRTGQTAGRFRCGRNATHPVLWIVSALFLYLHWLARGRAARPFQGRARSPCETLVQLIPSADKKENDAYCHSRQRFRWICLPRECPRRSR